jgi:hypothetical protein
VNLAKEKFDEIFDSGCWPAALSQDPKDEAIIQFVMDNRDRLDYAGKSSCGGYINCVCLDSFENEQNSDDENGWAYESKMKQLYADVFNVDVVCFDDHERDCWRVFYFNDFRDYRGEILPLSVFKPFFESVLNGDEAKLRDLAEYVDDFTGFAVSICPKCQRWSISS